MGPDITKVADIQLSISENKRLMRSWAATGIAEYGELSSSLKQKIADSSVISISLRYDSDNLDEAFDIIKSKWTRMNTLQCDECGKYRQDPHVQESFGIYPR